MLTQTSQCLPRSTFFRLLCLLTNTPSILGTPDCRECQRFYQLSRQGGFTKAYCRMACVIRTVGVTRYLCEMHCILFFPSSKVRIKRGFVDFESFRLVFIKKCGVKTRHTEARILKHRFRCWRHRERLAEQRNEVCYWAVFICTILTIRAFFRVVRCICYESIIRISGRRSFSQCPMCIIVLRGMWGFCVHRTCDSCA